MITCENQFNTFAEWVNYVYWKALDDKNIHISYIEKNNKQITLVVDLVTNKCGQATRNKKDIYKGAVGVAYAYSRVKGLPVLYEKDFLPKTKKISEIKTGDKFRLREFEKTIYCCKKEITVDNRNLIVCQYGILLNNYKVFNKNSLSTVYMVYDGD